MNSLSMFETAAIMNTTSLTRLRLLENYFSKRRCLLQRISQNRFRTLGPYRTWDLGLEITFIFLLLLLQPSYKNPQLTENNLDMRPPSESTTWTSILSVTLLTSTSLLVNFSYRMRLMILFKVVELAPPVYGASGREPPCLISYVCLCCRIVMWVLKETTKTTKTSWNSKNKYLMKFFQKTDSLRRAPTYETMRRF